ncbi:MULTISPECIES: LytR/AlgR family response regulator transcription factor [Leeuwenhoekiella]|jgi:DNA-binding LytR/AlgR family response regulator|uniref:Two-component system response regulator n=1 Tax=Leeuwenhoekiella blandensis (strain CECT 7118 / CCUG 51940 / KCTC 22103 / MED217) TaxID=398720 RepID=A3XK80_LEEBM|nr:MULTISPECIES: response regulator transcription factor [Leeuwenhoekiella]EAQ50038.1 two-component system response regulator [Leeuwenhoekiella blandensis MED217]MAO43238.1 DNA-binding response regulator [Leeuwenhoekiella sp.]HBT08572.1 DNA-binding response regulator [Leeuwenhoekiella sp.]HCW64764.1 DNA-binding response regulator [Leeuwenhoekiella sp.]|tara:strand:+ start:613 stop:1320 length:708 start_codon:yes stop_codon:yes gene_type:complete
MSLKCVIIDDEPLAINVIKNHIAQLKGLEIIKTFDNAIESLDFLRSNEVDLLFLDINMPVLDGLSFLKSLDTKPMVILTTAHEEYAVEGFELEVLDYLVKPISLPRFLKATNKALAKKQESPKTTTENESIFVKVDKKKMKKVYLDDILLVESLKDYIKIITINGNYVVHQTLGSFTDELPSNQFVRIHRSYTANINKVEAVEGNSVEIANKRYTIGRNYLEDAKNAILHKQSGN